MKTKSELDFLVIGAQKSGTTTLYKLISEHPEIYMPRQKEVHFFANLGEETYSNGMEWYLANFFADAPIQLKWGEVSPQYMTCLYAASRIAEKMPDTKLIAILRNPIDRCYSAYKMECRAVGENRDFCTVVNDLIGNNVRPEIGEAEYLQREDVLRIGLYGSILGNYLKYFSRDNIHICFLEDLEKTPELVVRGIYQFIGVDDDFTPENIGEKYHVGGTVRFSLLRRIHEVFRNNIKPCLPQLVLSKIQGYGYWLEQWNVTPDDNDKLINPELRMKLRGFFYEDILRFQREFGITVPWKEFAIDLPKNCG